MTKDAGTRPPATTTEPASTDPVEVTSRFDPTDATADTQTRIRTITPSATLPTDLLTGDETLPLNEPIQLDDEVSASIDPLEHTRELPALRADELWFVHDSSPRALPPGHELRWQDRTVQILSSVTNHTYERRYRVAVEGIDQPCILKHGAADAPFLRYDAEVAMLNAVFADGPCAGLPQVFGHWSTDDEQFILIEHLQGTSLAQWLDDHTLNLSAGISVLISLVRLLSRIHCTGHVLTSLRPTSVFLTQPDPTQPDGVFLDDFCNIVETLSPPPYPMASPYTSPEVSERSPADEDADFYSVGALLYRMVSGHDLPTYRQNRPFQPDSAPTRLPLVLQILSRTLTSPSERFIEVEDLERALLQLQRELQPRLLVRHAMFSSTGLNPLRIVNQDSAGYMEVRLTHRTEMHYRGFFCVADGMGGHAEGDRASELAVQGALARFQSLNSELPHDQWRTHNARLCKDMASAASRKLVDTIRAEGTRKKMGTTFTAVLIVDTTLSLAHVGDSRAILVRDDELLILSEDHSLVNMMVKAGQMTAEQAERCGEKNILMRSMGADHPLRPDMLDGLDILTPGLSLDLRAGDRVILLSDGVWGMIPRPDMLRILQSHADTKDACEQLCNEALIRGGYDNVAAIVLDVLPTFSPHAAVLTHALAVAPTTPLTVQS
jgi:serine/threonine protein phosphatase PrpC